ncbi:MAG: hypothetical protein IPL26_27430 [Leptospiraceae bacterium]|nr:hypothetical protein [Leptospiraceae bacterium]
MKYFKYFSLFILFALITYCASNYIEKIQKAENAFYKENYDTAIPELRELAKDANTKDELLYLMEAGTVFHTKGDYETSNKVFKDAEAISDTLKTSMTKEGLAFILSDNESNYKGESFERVLIKLYVAMNYLMLGKADDSKRYFKKVDFELKDMKVTDSKYKQNLFARYVDAVVSEQLKSFNDARVSYKNIMDINPDNKEIYADRYVLAVKEGDTRDQSKYAEGKKYIKAFNKNLQPIPYNPDLAEVLIINQAGKAATKESKGKIIEEPMIREALGKALEVALRNMSNEGMSLAVVMAMVSNAENPIPEYKTREEQKSNPIDIYANGTMLTNTKVYNDFSETAIANFNENYTTLVTKNITSIATKVAVAAVAAYAAGKAAESSRRGGGRGKGDDAGAEMAASVIGAIISAVAGAVAGAGVAATIKPDLRCWRTLPSNFQVRRVFLEPGVYDFEFKSNSSRAMGGKNFRQISVEPGKLVVINFRSI